MEWHPKYFDGPIEITNGEKSVITVFLQSTMKVL